MPFDTPPPRPLLPGERPLWDQALALVNRDLAATLPDWRPLCLLAHAPWAEGEPEQVYVSLADGASYHGQPLWPGSATSLDAAVSAVAEAAQDTVMEFLWQAWPVCPVHNLGMHVGQGGQGGQDGRDSDGPAWWCAGGTDPKDPDHTRAAVGALDTLQRPHRPNRKRRRRGR
ncbi:hypothetical protein ABZ915_21600 [Streptomyces sp. NPDC046915]|uniref:hypothetical protein n=1 Tax=Streptomyces sp. NPDC046915 TaxID=3155257 RepID=UPI0033C4A6C1